MSQQVYSVQWLPFQVEDLQLKLSEEMQILMQLLFKVPLLCCICLGILPNIAIILEKTESTSTNQLQTFKTISLLNSKFRIHFSNTNYLCATKGQ